MKGKKYQIKKNKQVYNKKKETFLENIEPRLRNSVRLTFMKKNPL